MRQWWILFSVVGVVALARCGGTASEGPEPGDGTSQVDGGAPDASTGGHEPVDAGSVSDAGVPDAGSVSDAGAPDAGGVPDAGAPDAGGGLPDAGESPDAGAPDAGPPDAGGTPDAGAPDAGSAPDAGAPDAGPPDAGAPDAGLPPDAGGEGPDAGTPGGGSGLACTFNSDCPTDERCECDDNTGDCQCLTGPRGTGRAGIDPCTTGNDCESSLCAEGWGGYYCSGECASSTDCGPRLPLCRYISFLGSICIRDPNGGP